MRVGLGVLLGRLVGVAEGSRVAVGVADGEAEAVGEATGVGARVGVDVSVIVGEGVDVTVIDGAPRTLGFVRSNSSAAKAKSRSAMTTAGAMREGPFSFLDTRKSAIILRL